MRFLTLFVLGTLAMAQNPPYQPVATSKHIMNGMQKPAMDSLTAMGKTGGPKSDEEWQLAEQHAAVLAETAQLLLMGARPKDQDVWLTSSQRLLTSASASAKAAGAHDLDAWKNQLNSMASACRACHKLYKKKQQ
jgi:hypothetical protein